MAPMTCATGPPGRVDARIGRRVVSGDQPRACAQRTVPRLHSRSAVRNAGRRWWGGRRRLCAARHTGLEAARKLFAVGVRRSRIWSYTSGTADARCSRGESEAIVVEDARDAAERSLLFTFVK